MRILSVLFVTILAGCTPLEVLDQDASEFEDAVSMPIDRSTGKPLLESNARSAGLEARGPATSGISSNSAVWDGSNRWYREDAAAGMAWDADSGLTWDEKYAVWVDVMGSTVGDDGYTTVEILTPDGRRVPSPRLECAEMGMFLRVLFAQWYDLPFFMTARHTTYGNMHFGHFGVLLDNGQRAPGYPNYATAYTDFTDQGVVGVDTALAARKLTQLEDDQNLFLGEDAYAGAYFDHLLANKRVGHFLHVLLTSFGSMHMAYSENTFDIAPDAMRQGDILVHRWQKQGIGHVMVLKEVDALSDRTSVEIMFGSMPRIQPAWYSEGQSRGYLLGDKGGSKELSSEGISYAELGGGLKRWRTPVVKDGRWLNIIPVSDRDSAVDGTDWNALGERVDDLSLMLGQLTPEEQLENVLTRIETARDNLRRRPASCANRIRREEAFDELYDVLSDQDQVAVDAEYRILEDYVFAELEYADSKTCCWNSTTPDMYQIVMDHAESLATPDTCVEPTVFKATDGGYQLWADYAASTDRGDLWVPWSEDEVCSQRDVQDDITVAGDATSFCELGGDLPGAVDNTDSCGGVTWTGECDGNDVRYCDESGNLQTYTCGTCGFDAANQYYDCID